MGTDIYMYVETKDKSGNWRMVKSPVAPCRVCKRDNENPCYFCESSSVFISRDYRMFAILAGVREDFLPEGMKTISEAKGIPKNVSEEVKEEILSNCWDGYSHYTLRQIKKHKLDEMDFEDFSDVLIPCLKRLAEECGGDGNVRIVFGFDG